MSQLNLHEIIRQQQEQLAAMQAQIQALLVAQGGAGEGGAVTGSNTGSHMEVAKPAIFNRVSQIRYSLVVILELNGVSEVQYKDVMMIDDGKYQ